MICNKCRKFIDKSLMEQFDSVPPMQRVGHKPVAARCSQCKQPVCGDCLWGHGLYIFTCQGECLKKWEERVRCCTPWNL